MKMPFTAAELEEMRRADEEIERNFRWTNEELREARERDAEGWRGREAEEGSRLPTRLP